MSKVIPADAPALDPASWLRKKADNVIDDVLPSGLAIRRKRQVSLESLATSGKLPLTLLTELETLGKSEDGGKVEVDLGSITENLHRYMGLVDAVFSAALVSPKIGETTNLDQGTLALAEFDDEAADKLYIFGEVMGATESLRPFRAEHDGDGTAAPPEQPVPSTAEQFSGDTG